MKTGDDLRFAFRHVKRRPVSLRDRRNEVHDEHREQRNQVPPQCAHTGALCINYDRQIQATRHHQNTDQCKPHGYFIGDDLRC